MNTAPGCRLRRWTTFWASTGSREIVSWFIVWPTLASTVLMIGVASVTVTVSATPPTASAASVRVVSVDLKDDVLAHVRAEPAQLEFDRVVAGRESG